MSSQKLIQAGNYRIQQSCQKYMHERKFQALSPGTVVDTKEKGALNSKVLWHSIALAKYATEPEISKQITFILRKANIDEMHSISMPILVDEPSTKHQRTLFFKMLPKACAAFIKDSIKSVKVIRIVSDDADTLNEAIREFEEWKANPTYLDSKNSSLNTTFIGNQSDNKPNISANSDYKPLMPGEIQVQPKIADGGNPTP
jgi:hypothetical protein